MTRVLVTLSFVLANVAACSKKADVPPSPPAGSGAAGSAAGSAGSGPAATGSAGSGAVGDGSAAGGSAAGGSAAAGSGGSAASGSAAGAPDARKFEDPRESELCSKVLKKIVACQKDKEFLTALDEGVDAKQKRLNARFLKEVARWKPAETECANLAPAIEYGGFLDHWERIAAVPDLIESCGKLGTMINAAGGLFGGDRSY